MLRYRPHPLMAILIAGLSLLVLSGAVYALGRTLGYLPGVGLVENSSGIRMLPEPVAVTRDGVTLTISSLIAYEDHLALIYDVKGIAPENDAAQAEDAGANPTGFCGGVEIGSAPGVEGDARLQLPDGTLLERDRTGKYPQNAFAMQPVYAASVPAEVNRLTFLLDCIPQARLGAAPENWTVPLELKAVPAGTVVGAPVIEIEPTAVSPTPEPVATQPAPEPTAAAPAATVPSPLVTMNLSRIVPLDTRTIFYFSLDMETPDPSLISIMPTSAFVVDSQGQKIRLVGGFTWQPFEHRVGSEFEFVSESKPAPGPLTLVVENAVAYYAPMYVEPRQATPEEMSFTFDVGANPQYGQTWDLDHTFEIAGYTFKMTSARAAVLDDLGPFDIPGPTEGFEYGYDFGMETDPALKLQPEMDIMVESPRCDAGRTAKPVYAPDSSTPHFYIFCQGYPTGNLRVTIRELAVLVEHTWQAQIP